jgi:AraC-like DNA-binding protein
LVLSYWGFQADSAPPPDEPYTVFPDGCASVALVRTGIGATFVALIGPRSTRLTPPFTAGTRIWGIRFWPDAIASTLGVSARSIRNYFGVLPRAVSQSFAGLDDVVPRTDDPHTAFSALDRWCGTAVVSSEEPDPRIRRAIRSLVSRRGEGAMEDAARDAAVGLRHLQRLFPEATGLTLREFARVRRLREALAQRLTPDAPAWSRIAAGAGFVDHAHLTREFLALIGVAPTAAARQMTRTAHRGVRP